MNPKNSDNLYAKKFKCHHLDKTRKRDKVNENIYIHGGIVSEEEEDNVTYCK